jgi:hypothetical protein
VDGNGGADPGHIRTDRLRILQDHLISLRQETGGWLERQARVWQTAIAGVAAVFVFRENASVETFLPLAPILAMAVLAQWLSLVVMVVRAGRAMTVDEYRVNDLVGKPQLLTHEIGLWRRRSRWLVAMHKGPMVAVVVVATVVLGGAYGLLLGGLVRLPDLDLSAEAKAAYGVAGAIALSLVITNVVRLFRLELWDPQDEARRGLPDESPARNPTALG